MRNVYLMLSALLASTGVNAQNTCATALNIAPGTHVVQAVDGTEISSPYCVSTGLPASMAEWFRYTPLEDHGVTVTTDLLVNSGGDTRFHVYTGSCGALVCVSGDDDGGVIGNGWLSIATFNVTAGTSYTIVFDNAWNSGGFTFELIEGDTITNGGGGGGGGGTMGFTPVGLSVMGTTACVVDMDGDLLDDVVSVTSTLIVINHQQVGGGFVPTGITTTPADYTPSWSIAAGDIDRNGYIDLLYGSGSGVTFMYASDDGTAFTEVSGQQYVFSQRSNFVDINSDGHLDAFVCHDVAPNVYYINDGSGNLVFNQGGLGPNGGNYGSIWTDFDNDGDVDLFIAKCGSSPPDVFMRNNGDGSFTDVAAPLGFADGQQSWSSAWGDFDNDGDMDVMVGSSGGSTHKLMRNNGDGTFSNITVGSGFETFIGTSIEWTTHDFDNDGRLDILGGGQLLLNNGGMSFTPVTITPTNGPIGDLNNDGFLDILNSGTAYMNDGNANNYLKVYTIGTASNANGIGARVRITSSLGSQVRDVKSGDGFRYMSSITTHFGLGTDTEVEELVIQWPSGTVDVIPNPPINGTLVVTESISTGVGSTNTSGLLLYPNPATDVIRISGDLAVANRNVRIFDATGKAVLSTVVQNGRVDVTALTSGVYLLRLEVDGTVHQQSFTKQ